MRRDASAALRLSEGLAAERSSDPATRYSLANAYAAVGMAESGLNQAGQALAHFRQGTAEMEKLVVREQANRFLVSHGSTIAALTGVYLGTGEMVVVTPAGDGTFAVKGKLRLE